METLDDLLDIIENPYVEKFYINLKKKYELNKMFHEAEAIDYLIKKKFHAIDNMHLNEKQ